MQPTIAKVYAQALYYTALEQEVLDQVHQGACYMVDCFAQTPHLVAYLNSPLVNHQAKAEACRKLLMGHSPLLANFLLLALRRERSTLLCTMVEQFLIFYKAKQHQCTARVTSAHPLTKPLKKALTAHIQQLTQCQEVVLATELDPSLLGGYILAVDGKQLDASLRTAIRQLRYLWQGSEKH